MKKLLVLLLLMSSPLLAQTRIKDIPLTDSQANSDQWIVTDDTSDDLTKKMTLTTLFAGWSGGVSLIGSPLTTETLTLKGSALNDGAVCINPSGGNVAIGHSSPGSTLHAKRAGSVFSIFESTDATGFAGFEWRNGTQSWQWSIAGATLYARLRDVSAGADVFVVEPGADANSLYVDADGNVGLGTTSPKGNGLTIRPGGDAGATPFGPGANGIVIANTSGAADTAGIQMISGLTGSSSLSFGDSATYLRSAITFNANTNTLCFGLNVCMDYITSTETVINDESLSRDFRVEGDNDANSLFVDAGTDNVGIGNNAPARDLHITDTMRLEPRASPPAGAAAGDIYYDTSGAFCGYDGVAAGWVVLGGAGSCA